MTGRTPKEVVMTKTARTAIACLGAIAAIAALLPGASQNKAARATGLDPAAIKAINEVGGDLEKLAESHRNLMKAVSELDALYAELSRKVEELSRLAADAEKAKGEPADRLFEATRRMREMQMSFNLQYLMLQNRISQENRQFSMISNIMKNKHDTAKNSVNNVR
jgi:predicted  nucleic acid-binding Zn-ribbon protein